MFGPLRFVTMLQKLYPFWRDPSQIEASQQKRLRALLAHAAENSPYYRRRFAGLDVSRCALSELPTLSKGEMMENFDELVTDPRLRKTDLSAFVDNPDNLGRYYLGDYSVSHTSGSQGQPARSMFSRGNDGRPGPTCAATGSSIATSRNCVPKP